MMKPLDFHSDSHKIGGVDEIKYLKTLRDRIEAAETSIAAIDTDSPAVNGGYLSEVYVRKTADVSINSQTTPQNDADLKRAIAANEIWIVNGLFIVIAANATPNFRYDFSIPAGCDGAYWAANVNASPATDVANDRSPSIDTTVDVANGLYTVIPLHAYFINGGTAGDIQFRWAQATSDVNNVTLKKGSYLHCLRIA